MSKNKHVDGVIYLDVFNIQVGVFWNTKRCNKFLKHKGIKNRCNKNSFGEVHVFTGNNGNLYFVILIKKDANVSTMAHEASHMADFICEFLGIPISCKNTETRAYIVGYIVGKLMALREDKN